MLTGYLTANSDPGEDYGKLTLLTLPKDNSIPAPGQVENDFTTNTAGRRAAHAAAWKRRERGCARQPARRVPVGGGLLYVQPVYVQSTSGTVLPLLRKVLVGFGDSIAFEDTLDAALDKLFGGDSGADAGDGDVPVDPETPVDPENPTDPETPPTEPDNPALQQALADYQAALADRRPRTRRATSSPQAEADARMVEAIERAIEAAG